MPSARTEIPDVELPADFAATVQTAAGLDDPPETLHEGLPALEVVLEADESGIAPDDLFQDSPTRHELRFDDRVEHVPCLLDALFVARLVDADPVGVRSTPPAGGDPIEFTLTDGDVAVDPADASTSIGFSRDDAADWSPEFLEGALHGADFDGLPTCDLINAFPDANAYEDWRATVPDQPVMRLSADEMISLSAYTADVYSPG